MMKNLNLRSLFKLRSLALTGILALAVFAVSCNKEDSILPTPGDEALKSGKAVKKSDMTIADIVVAAKDAEEPQFTLLYGALEYTGLTGVFAGTDQYTVFAPTDQAFIDLVVALSPLPDADSPFAAIDAKLGEGTVASVLLYHVTDGRRAANSVLPMKDGQMKTITTLQGQSFDVDNMGMIYTASDGMSSIVTEGGAGTTFNISASNGIIHVISSVMIPEL